MFVMGHMFNTVGLKIHKMNRENYKQRNNLGKKSIVAILTQEWVNGFFEIIAVWLKPDNRF